MIDEVEILLPQTITEDQSGLFDNTGNPIPVVSEWASSKRLEDGRRLFVYPLTFGKGRLCLSDYDGYEIMDEWHYERHDEALHAMEMWVPSEEDGEPEGWFRHPGTGRRRMHGDPMREYTQW